MLKKTLLTAFMLLSLSQTSFALVPEVVGAAGELTAGAVDTAADVAEETVETAADVTGAVLGAPYYDGDYYDPYYYDGPFYPRYSRTYYRY